MNRRPSLGGKCTTCGTLGMLYVVGVSPHIDTGESIPQVTCRYCGSVHDAGTATDSWRQQLDGFAETKEPATPNA